MTPTTSSTYRIQARARLERRRREQRRSFAKFADAVSRANYRTSIMRYRHVRETLVPVCQRVADGDLGRVIVLMPPRYFKSETISRLFASYYLRRFPRRHVGLASYGAQLAWELSEEAQNYFQQSGGAVRSETSAKRRWRTREGGEMWADGVGGSLLGRGYDLGIVDDPIDPEKAHSPTFQRRFEEWWPAKWLSRAEPGAAIIVVMQRLGTSDPIDFLFRREVGEDTDEAPEGWHVVCFDEIKEDRPLAGYDGPMGLPPTCTLEEDPRAMGEVLAPQRFDLEAVEKKQATAGTYVKNAQRQQRPAAPTGDFWQAGWFQTYDELPPDAYNGGKDWDTAYTADESNSASAFVESYRGPGDKGEFPIYIEDVDWKWLESPELVYWMGGRKPKGEEAAGIVPVKGPHYVEEKASGKSVAQALRRENVPVDEVPVEGDKFARARSVQPVVSQGRVYVSSRVRRKLLKGDRQGLLRVTAEQLLAGGPDLDVNDAFVQAILRHTSQKDLPSSPQSRTGRRSGIY